MSLVCVRDTPFISLTVPDEEGAPFLVDDDVGRGHEDGVLLGLHQAVLPQSHPVLLALAVGTEHHMMCQ